MPKHSRLLSIIVCFLVFTFLVDSTSAAAFKRVHAGEEAPSFTLPDLDGNPVNLDDHRDGPLTIVTFWALWSPKSEPLLADIQKILAEFGDQGVSVKAIAINEDGDQASTDFESQVRALVERNGIAYPVVVDQDMSKYAEWGVIATPSTAFLGKDLKVEYEFSGRPSSAYEDMRAEVMRVLGIAEEIAEESKPKRDRYEAPRAALLNFGLTQTLFKRGQFSKARRKMRKVLKADPSFPDAHALSGAIHLGLSKEGKGKGDPEATARAAFAKAVELDPTVPLGNIGLAHFALVDDDPTAAAGYVREAVKYTEDEDLPELPAAEGDSTTTPDAAAASADAATMAQVAVAAEAAPLAESTAAAVSADAAVQATAETVEELTPPAAESTAPGDDSSPAAAVAAYLDHTDALLAGGDTEAAKARLRAFVDAYLNLAEGPSMTKKGLNMLRQAR